MDSLRFSTGRRAGFQSAAVALAGVLLVTAAAQAAPKVQVEPMKIELGQIEEGLKFERFVELKNVGDEILVLEDISTSCGCTAAAVEGLTELRAGESQTVKVTFNSKAREGKVSQKVRLTTNDPDQKVTTIELHADVHKPVRWEPRYLNLKRIDPADGYREVLRLEADRNLGMKVETAQVITSGGKGTEPSTIFGAEVLTPRVEGDRDVYDIVLSLAEEAGAQRVNQTLRVTTNLPADRDTLRIPVRGEIVGRLRVYPQYAAMPLVTPGETGYRDVVVEAARGTVKLTKVEFEQSDSPITIEVLPPNGSKTTVRLAYVGDDPKQGGVKTLVIETDDEVQDRFEIPVRYQTRLTPNTDAAEAGSSD